MPRATTQTAGRRFGRGAFEQTASMRVLHRVVLPVVILHVMAALWSGYRAIYQVFSLDLRAPDEQIGAGTTLGFNVLSSGRVPVTVILELVQGSRADTLFRTRLRSMSWAGYDPRPLRAIDSVTLSRDVLAHFDTGAAVVRVTALGASQWLRTPPPTIRERNVRVMPAP